MTGPAHRLINHSWRDPGDVLRWEHYCSCAEWRADTPNFLEAADAHARHVAEAEAREAS